MRGAVLARPRAAWIGAGLAATGAGAGRLQHRHQQRAVTVTGKTLTIYASQPPGGAGGAVAADVLDAEQLALQQAGDKVGHVHRQARPRRWPRDLGQRPHRDPELVRDRLPGGDQPGDLGRLDPDHQRAGPAPGLADRHRRVPDPGQPRGQRIAGLFYPESSTYHRTFARVVPTTLQEAKAIISEMQLAAPLQALRRLRRRAVRQRDDRRGRARTPRAAG